MLQKGCLRGEVKNRLLYAEDVDQWLSIDKDLQQETLSDDDIIATVTGVVQDDDTEIDDNFGTKKITDFFNDSS